MRAVTITVKDKITPPQDLGAPPMLNWLPIADLVIDDQYQRELNRANWSAIAKIARDFHWSRFSPVFVAPSLGGKYAIIDGQHRTHAAALCGIEAVPCQIVQMDAKQQAASFAAINGMATKVTPYQIFRAGLAAGEQWAVDCAASCADAGCRLMTSYVSGEGKKPGQITTISLIRSHVDKGRRASVTLALRGVRNSEFGKDAAAYATEVLKPLFAAVVDRPWLARNGTDLTGFMDDFDIYSALDNAAEFAKRKRRESVDISRFDIAAADIGSALDKAFPQRMALPVSAGVSHG